MSKVRNRISPMGTVGTFMMGRACSDTLFHVLSDAYGHPSKPEELATMPFAGGIMQHGYQCGMIWGAALAAGAQAYRLFGPGSRAETMATIAAQRLVASFRALNNNINCLEITEIDKSSTNWEMVVYFLIKGGTIGCFRQAARYAPKAFDEVNAALSATDVHTPAPPVSCSAMLAQKMGVSGIRATMVAGLAGGIGLCGGACGALGAAVWFLGLNALDTGAEKLDFKQPKALDLIDRFVKSTNYQFECSQIVGRKFENVDDHAAHLRNGGCAQIIEVLAAQ
jgi:hypothetical protein